MVENQDETQVLTPAPEDFSKNPLASKQVQVALLTAAVKVATMVKPEIGQLIKDNFDTILLVAPAVLLWLRTKTVEPISWKKLKPSAILSISKKF